MKNMEILNGLKNHIQKEKASFHMPGHKNGAAFLGTELENEIFKLDTTELFGTDSLYAPDSMIKKAQEFAACCYGASEAHFLVNGSTSGILSMFFACFGEGDVVIVDRNCHKSAISALILTGAVPVYITPEKNEELEVSGRISPEKVESLFKKHPNIKGVYVTSPNYYGICSDVKKIADIAHKYNSVLLVDEAHGAHFPFSRHFPENAMAQGADVSVVSIHKSMAAPNQTAILMKKGSKVNSEALKNAVNMFQTTSPSYILMTYLEAAISAAHKKGEELTETFVKYRKNINAKGSDDPFKIVLSFAHKGISGAEAEEIFRKKFGIFAELSDHKNVLMMASWGNTEADFKLLKTACSYIENLPKKTPKAHLYPVFSENMPLVSPKKIYSMKKKYVPLENAAGKISADTITTFPPCIPIILPGEIIKKEQIDFLISFNGKISGITEGKIKTAEE